MKLTCKNRGFYYNSGGRIKSWNFRSAPNVVVHILENPVNSYDSNGAIAVPYLLWGMRNGTCCPSVYLFFSSESPEHIGSYYTSLEKYFQGEHNAVGIV